MPQALMTLTAKKQLTSDVFELTFSGDTSGISAPGQFVNIEISEHFLRRPISVCDYAENSLTLICRAGGSGTRTLCAAAIGTEFDMLTGLGNGYSIEKSTDKPVLIGGGVGVPPLYALAKALLARGITPTVALGFGSKSEVFYEDAFKKLGCEVLVSTVDGSYGSRGFVTDLVRNTNCDYCFCCGPEPMLKAVYALSLSGGQYSFEERMGCGFGACVGCTCKTKYGSKRICKDGPVLEQEEIIW